MQYKLKQVIFLGHKIILEKGLKPDPENIKAINALESPTNKNEVLRILRLLKFFSKLIPNLSQLTTNMRIFNEFFLQITKFESVFCIKNSTELAKILNILLY